MNPLHSIHQAIKVKANFTQHLQVSKRFNWLKYTAWLDISFFMWWYVCSMAMAAV